MLSKLVKFGSIGLITLCLSGIAAAEAGAKPAPKAAVSKTAKSTKVARPSKHARHAPHRATSDLKAVKGASEAFRAAMVAGDGKSLTRLASPGLSFGHSNGLVQTREEFVGSVVQKKEIFREIKLVDQKVRVYGRTAVSRHEFHADILLEGKPLNVKLQCIEVWDKTSGGWKLVSRQAFKV
jgi:hypothetical protein